MRRDRRYGEKLATPDTTIADLIGEVDPIKVAEGRYLSDELTISYGLIPRTNRGIFSSTSCRTWPSESRSASSTSWRSATSRFAATRSGCRSTFCVVASANPEDYTNRGRIITPLKDRYGSQIRTHYPRDDRLEIEIMEQERAIYRHGRHRGRRCRTS